MWGKIRPFTVAIVAITILSGCDSAVDDGDKGHHRAMQEFALSYGAQAGLHWKTSLIVEYLDKHSQQLDQVFNFNALLMQHNILPPVVVEYGKSYTIQNDSTVRLSDQEIKMLRPARFVSVAPSWRDYIYLAYAEPEMPPETLLPQNEIEAAMWRESVLEGWEVGVEQASAIFQDALSRLSQEFEGMILYHRLHIQNMISAPYAETTHLGVTGDNQSLRLNDKIIKIVNPSVLNPNTHQWQPILYDETH